MQAFADIIISFADWFWGLPVLIILSAVSLFLSFRLGFFQFCKFGYIMKSTLGKMFHKGTNGEGTLSPFQALTSALACTVGAGNIVGVPIAIVMGGPGAVFWMWLMALLGMVLKYGEIVLAVKYRQQNERGEYVGGPTYYMSKGMNAKWLASIFGFSLMIEVAISSMTQTNAMSSSAQASLNIPPLFSGLAIMAVTAIVIIGGIKRLGEFTEKLVPLMAAIYVCSSLIIVVMNISQVPEMFKMIFQYAFTPMSAVGGFTGSAVAMSIRWGVARCFYSNEAGLGTAPIAHAAATTDHPTRQGLWGVTEIFLDTIVICTCTAFVVLSTGVWKTDGAIDLGGGLATLAFQNSFGPVGGILLTICLILFVFSTLIVLIWYGEKQAEFLFGRKIAVAYRVLCVLLIPFGAMGGAKYLWQFLDFSLAMILIPNVIAIVYLNKDIVACTKEFFNTPGKYYLKDTGDNKQKATS